MSAAAAIKASSSTIPHYAATLTATSHTIKCTAPKLLPIYYITSKLDDTATHKHSAPSSALRRQPTHVPGRATTASKRKRSSTVLLKHLHEQSCNTGLRCISTPLSPQRDIRSQYYTDIYRNLAFTLKQANGMGLAAPQVGLNKQVFVAHLSPAAAVRQDNCNDVLTDIIDSDGDATSERCQHSTTPHRTAYDNVITVPMCHDGSTHNTAASTTTITSSHDTNTSMPSASAASASPVRCPFKPTIFINSRIIERSERYDDAAGRYEGCLSIPHYMTSHVKRSYSVEVEYYDTHAQLQRCTLYGLDARIFLHEYDHLQGRLYIDYLTSDSQLQRFDFSSNR